MPLLGSKYMLTSPVGTKSGDKMGPHIHSPFLFSAPSTPLSILYSHISCLNSFHCFCSFPLSIEKCLFQSLVTLCIPLLGSPEKKALFHKTFWIATTDSMLSILQMP